MKKITPGMLVGFAGLAQSGKTTSANILRGLLLDKYQFEGPMIDVTVWSFAAPIRLGLATMGITKNGTPTLFRKAAQAVGKTVREENPNHWVDLHNIHRNPDSHSISLVDDVRYENNEVPCFLANDNTMLFYVDGGVEAGRCNLSDPLYQHESEAFAMMMNDNLCRHINPYVQHYPRFCLLDNRGTMDALTDQLKRYV